MLSTHKSHSWPDSQDVEVDQIPKVWKTMCKGQLHKLVSVMLWHANGSVYQCQADYDPKFQWALNCKVGQSSFPSKHLTLCNIQHTIIVPQFPGLSITLNRADKAHCSSCLEPKKAFREQEEALELTSGFEKELSMYPCYTKQEVAKEWNSFFLFSWESSNERHWTIDTKSKDTKKSSQRNQNPSWYYNSITSNFKFQHKP